MMTDSTDQLPNSHPGARLNCYYFNYMPLVVANYDMLYPAKDAMKRGGPQNIPRRQLAGLNT